MSTLVLETPGLIARLRYRAESLVVARPSLVRDAVPLEDGRLDGRMTCVRLWSAVAAGARDALLGVRKERVIDRPKEASLACWFEVEAWDLVGRLLVLGV